ncbi:hypothetical protein GGX14DRAFT_451146 [Mycena pura]|uniref:Uncharacterized protein n=1 Tax=Mycena pura TaxID=153505 RepID=A0AAD6VEH0_9AGAR|nr:hypothetical protein GGX14DRAFT_451146 [Mycena pura]
MFFRLLSDVGGGDPESPCVGGGGSPGEDDGGPSPSPPEPLVGLAPLPVDGSPPTLPVGGSTGLTFPPPVGAGDVSWNEAAPILGSASQVNGTLDGDPSSARLWIGGETDRMLDNVQFQLLTYRRGSPIPPVQLSWYDQHCNAYGVSTVTNAKEKEIKSVRTMHSACIVGGAMVPKVDENKNIQRSAVQQPKCDDDTEALEWRHDGSKIIKLHVYTPSTFTRMQVMDICSAGNESKKCETPELTPDERANFKTTSSTRINTSRRSSEAMLCCADGTCGIPWRRRKKK